MSKSADWVREIRDNHWKFTHTWIRQGGTWQIVTRMCAAQEPVKTLRDQGC